MITRRNFIQKTLMTTAASTFSHSVLSLSAANDYLSFDLHAHPGMFFGRGLKQYPGDQAVLKTTADMNSGGLTGAFFSLVADVGIIEIGRTGVRPVRKYAAGEAWIEYKKQLDGLRELLKSLPATAATKTADLDKA